MLNEPTGKIYAEWVGTAISETGWSKLDIPFSAWYQDCDGTRITDAPVIKKTREDWGIGELFYAAYRTPISFLAESKSRIERCLMQHKYFPIGIQTPWTISDAIEMITGERVRMVKGGYGVQGAVPCYHSGFDRYYFYVSDLPEYKY